MLKAVAIFESGGGGGGVTSLNSLTGALNITSTGATIVITEVGSNVNLEASGGSSVSFTALTSGTNTAAAMVVGSGASLAPTGSGAITATIAPAGTLTGTVLKSTVVTSSLTTVGTIGTGVWQGTKIGLAYGGTNADLSASGGTSFVLQQASSGAAITVGQLAASDLSNGTTGSGTVVLATSPILVTPALGTPSALVGTNITGTAASLTSGITNALKSASTTVNVSSATAPTTGQVLTATGASAATWQTPTTGITTISVATANGLAGSSSGGATPALTLSTTITGVLLGDGTQISASNVTNDAQTKAAIVPNTAPSAGQILVGNAGGTAYAPVSASGAFTLASTGAATIATPGTLTVSSSNSTATAHTHAITSSSAPGAAASILATDASGIIGSTSTRIVKGWFTDLTVTNTITGSITGNAATVTTNANLTGPITSSGNATAIAAQTGTGTTFVMSVSPTITTAALGSSTATTQSPGDNSTKLATTAYVAAALLGQNYKEACKYATTGALPAIVYANGSSGVGATLTGVSVGALSIDSNSPAVNDRVTIKNQVSTFQNGMYTVTATGSGIAVFVLTRTTDFNQSSEINAGDTVFITAGTLNSNTTWTYNGADAPVIGTDAITFAQTAGQGSFTAGNGIAITGTSIAIDTSITVDKTTAQTLTNKTLTGPVMTAPVLGTPASGTLTNCTGYSAGSLAGSTLASGVTASSLTSVGTLTALTVGGKTTTNQLIAVANAITASGNAATVPITFKNNIVTNNSAATLTITLTTSGAVNMQDCIVQILDASGVAQTITWVNTEDSTTTVPTTSNGSTTLPLSVGFKYNSATSKWRCLAVA